MTQSNFSTSSGFFGASRVDKLARPDPSAVLYSKIYSPGLTAGAAVPGVSSSMDENIVARPAVAFFVLQAWVEWFKKVAIWQKLCETQENNGATVAVVPVRQPTAISRPDDNENYVESDGQDEVSQNEPRAAPASTIRPIIYKLQKPLSKATPALDGLPPTSSLSAGLLAVDVISESLPIAPISPVRENILLSDEEIKFYREQKQFDAKVYEWYTALSTTGTVSQIALFSLLDPSALLIILAVVGVGLLYRYVGTGNKELRLRLGETEDEEVIKHGIFSKRLSSFRDLLAVVAAGMYMAAQVSSVSAMATSAVFDPSLLLFTGGAMLMLAPLIWYLARCRINKQFDKEAFATNYKARMYVAGIDGLYMGSVISAIAIAMTVLVNAVFGGAAFVSAPAVGVTLIACCALKLLLEGTETCKDRRLGTMAGVANKRITAFFKSGKNMWALGFIGLAVLAVIQPELALLAGVGWLGYCLKAGYGSATASSYESAELKAVAKQWIDDAQEQKEVQAEQVASSALITCAKDGQSMFKLPIAADTMPDFVPTPVPAPMTYCTA